MFTADDRAALARLVRELGEAARRASRDELATLRAVLADYALPAQGDMDSQTPLGIRLRATFVEHIVEGAEWPAGTTVAGYLESLRLTVRDPNSGLRIYLHSIVGLWMILAVRRPRREWIGPLGGSRVVVPFNGERGTWITRFQVPDGRRYAQRQGGW